VADGRLTGNTPGTPCGLWSRWITHLDDEITNHEKALTTVVDQAAPQLVVEVGIGPITAAAFYIAWTYTTPHVGAGSVFLLEAVLSAIFVMVILQSTKKWPREAPIAISLTLMAIHFAAVPLTGASVNPARTLGPGIIGGSAPDLWVYPIAPPVGAGVAWLLYRLFHAQEAAAPDPNERS